MEERETWQLLEATSRSFYLSLRFLPAATRLSVGLAYALARAADSVADIELLPRADRLAGLEALIAAFRAPDDAELPPLLARCQEALEHPAEARLLAALPGLLRAYAALPALDRRLVGRVLETLCAGMVWDLERFPGRDARTLTALDEPAELDRYTYLVAGCVGEFWTELHAARLGWPTGPERERLIARGVRLGKGLQLVNVLRDCPRDLAAGRCYLPRTELAALGLAPRELLDPACAPRAWPLFERWLERASAHFDAGWEYCAELPRGSRRLLLCSLWPLLLGVKTVRELYRHRSDLLRRDRTIKVARREVYRMLLATLLRVPSRDALARLYRAERARARRHRRMRCEPRA